MTMVARREPALVVVAPTGGSSVHGVALREPGPTAAEVEARAVAEAKAESAKAGASPAAPVEEGINQAISNAMDRTIRSLVQDDYFLIEIQ